MRVAKLLLAFLLSGTASAATLTPWQSLDAPVKNTVPASLLMMKGQGTDYLYPPEVDQTLGAILIEGVAGGTPVPVSGSIVASNPSVGPTGSSVPADATYSGMNVGGNLTGLTGTANGLKVDGSAVTQPISATSLPLPTGASTNAELVTINTTLGSPLQAGGTVVATQATGSNLHADIDNFPSTQPVSGTVAVSNFPATQPISAVSLPLPTGAATSALQTTINTTLGSPMQQTGGTVTANAGTGNFTVVQSTASNLNATITGTVTANAGTGTMSVTGTGSAGTPASGIVTVQGNASGTPIPISGSITANNSSVSATGSAIPASATFIGASLAGTLQGLTQTSAGLKVDGSTVTQPVSGTVTANAGTGTFTTSTSVSSGTFQDGSIAAASLTTSFATVVTTGGVVKHVDMRNNTNGIVVISLNGGTSTSYTLDPGDDVSLDLSVNGSSISSSTALQAKYSGSAPTTGNIRINDFY